MSMFNNLLGTMRRLFHIGGPSGNSLKNVSDGIAIRNSGDTSYLNLRVKQATGSVDEHAVNWLDIKDSNVLIKFSFDGSSAPAPGTNTGMYGFCHTGGGGYTEGQIYNDNGLELRPIKITVGITMSTDDAVTGNISLEKDSIYIATSSTAPFSWEKRGGASDTLNQIASRRFVVSTSSNTPEQISFGKNESAAVVDSFSSISGATIAVGTSSTDTDGGIICAELPGNVSTTPATDHIVDEFGRIINLGIVRHVGRNTLVYETVHDRQVFALFQCSQGTQDGVSVDASNQVQISCVTFNTSGQIEVVNNGDLGVAEIDVQVPRLYNLESLPNTTRLINEYVNDEYSSGLAVESLDDLSDAQSSTSYLTLGRLAGQAGGANNNLAVGPYALQNAASNSRYNVMVGPNCGQYPPNIRYSIGIGSRALRGSSSSSYTPTMNIAIGYESMRTITSASYNVSIGANSMRDISGATWNVAIGASTLMWCSSSSRNNVAIGANAIRCGNAILTGSYNVAVGSSALNYLESGDSNVMFGRETGYRLENGSDNFGAGRRALYALTSGDKNFALGTEALTALTSGISNVAIGDKSAYHSTNINRCIMIGAETEPAGNTSGGHDQVVIGSGATGVENESITIGGPSYNTTYILTKMAVGSGHTPHSTLNIANLQNNDVGLSSGDVYTQTASELGGSGTTKVLCIV